MCFKSCTRTCGSPAALRAFRQVRLLQARPVDESAVLAQADRVMNLEREIKKAHLSLLVRVKNLLTQPQQDKLAALRRKPPN